MTVNKQIALKTEAKICDVGLHILSFLIYYLNGITNIKHYKGMG